MGWGTTGLAPSPITIKAGNGIVVAPSATQILISLAGNETTGGTPSYSTVQLTGVQYGSFAFVNESGWLVGVNLTAGANIVISDAPYTPLITIATSLTPSFTTSTFTQATAQLIFNSGSGATFSVLAPSGARTYTWNDPGASANVVLATASFTTNGSVYATGIAQVASTSTGNLGQVVGFPGPGYAPVPITIAAGNGIVVAPSGTQILISLAGNETTGGTPSYSTVQLTGVQYGSFAFVNETGWVVGVNLTAGANIVISDAPYTPLITVATAGTFTSATNFQTALGWVSTTGCSAYSAGTVGTLGVPLTEIVGGWNVVWNASMVPGLLVLASGVSTEVVGFINSATLAIWPAITTGNTTYTLYWGACLTSTPAGSMGVMQLTTMSQTGTGNTYYVTGTAGSGAATTTMVGSGTTWAGKFAGGTICFPSASPPKCGAYCRVYFFTSHLPRFHTRSAEWNAVDRGGRVYHGQWDNLHYLL